MTSNSKKKDRIPVLFFVPIFGNFHIKHGKGVRKSRKTEPGSAFCHLYEQKRSIYVRLRMG